MTTAQGGYTPVSRWVKQGLGDTHTTVVATVAWAVRCLLVAQRVTAAALARALPAEPAGSGRSCLRRGRRWGHGPALEQTTISPALIGLALTLLADAQPVVALDTTRLGPWAVWLAGLVVAGRTRPIGWALIPSPWPKHSVHPRARRPRGGAEDLWQAPALARAQRRAGLGMFVWPRGQQPREREGPGALSGLGRQHGLRGRPARAQTRPHGLAHVGENDPGPHPFLLTLGPRQCHRFASSPEALGPTGRWEARETTTGYVAPRRGIQ
jgi:hypothetical protein